MNVFKALSEGNGRISETNITSFVSYLLNSSNELKNSFFVMFAHLMDSELKNNQICDLLNIKQKSIRAKIASFSSKYIVSSEPEHRIQKEDGKTQIPDTLVRICLKSTGEIKAFILIENKIKKESKTSGQIEKQLMYFKNYDEDYAEDIPVYFVYITPDEEAFKSLYESASRENANIIWLKWLNHTDNDNSIEAKLREIVRYEQNAEIEPIDPNTQFIIKSFIDYLATEFSEKEKGKMNYSVNGFDVVSQAVATVNSKSYIIKRFENNMIRLYDKNEELLDIPVKPILREINTTYNLGIDLCNNKKITQMLGKEVIDALNKNNAT